MRVFELPLRALPWLAAAVGGLLALLVLALYFRGVFRAQVIYRLERVPRPGDGRFEVVMASLCSSQSAPGRATGFYLGAEAIYAARLEAIRAARRTIHFETFFFTPGRRADEFADVLIERARAGVRVRLIVDHSGAKPVPEAYWARLRAAGVEVRQYNAFHLRAPFEYLRRTHRKLMLVDGRVALIGGTGVSDDWDGKAAIGDRAPWLDCEVRLEGPVVARLEGIFALQWVHVGGVADLGPDAFGSALVDAREGDETVLVTPGDSPSRADSPLRALFRASVAMARRRVWIASPYFLPDREWRRTLLAACVRGVDVRVLTTGMAVDMRPVYFASRELYPELIRGGVKIYEYQPAMMHAKAMLIDDDWASTGSANFDPRSFFDNEELNVSTAAPGLAREFEGMFLAAFARSRLMTFETWKHRPAMQKAVGKFVLLFRSQL